MIGMMIGIASSVANPEISSPLPVTEKPWFPPRLPAHKSAAPLSAAAEPPSEPSPAAAQAHGEWQRWSTPAPREGVAMDLGPCVAAMREALPADTIICNGAGNYSGWWHRYWPYAGPGSQLAPTAGAMGTSRNRASTIPTPRTCAAT